MRGLAFTAVLLALACGSEEPSQADLEAAVREALPAALEVTRLEATRLETTASGHGEPHAQAFRLEARALEPLYRETSRLGGRVLLGVVHEKDAAVSLRGVVRAQAADPGWDFEVDFDAAALAEAGKPRSAYGRHSLLAGTPEARAFRRALSAAARGPEIPEESEARQQQRRAAQQDSPLRARFPIQLSRQSRHVGGCPPGAAMLEIMELSLRFPGICRDGEWSRLDVWLGDIESVRLRRNGFIEVLPPLPNTPGVFRGFWPEGGPRDPASAQIAEALEAALSAWRAKHPDLQRQPN